MITYDSQRTIDASGAFLIGELERLDPEINLPLVGTTYTRDIQFREDVNIADEISSFTKTGFAAAGTGANPKGKNWVSQESTALAGINLDIPLNIRAVKWLKGAGIAGKDRMVAYTNDRKYVRFPLVPLTSIPIQYRGLWQLVTYYGKLGVVEAPYIETLAYFDGI